MRLLFLILLLLNAVAYGYIRFAEGRAGSDNQLPLLQIAPEKMKLLKPGAAPPPRSDAARAQPQLVCLEWVVFAGEESARAVSALMKVGISDNVTQRETAVAGSLGNKTTVFVIRDPGDALAAKIAALKADFPAAQLKVTTCAEALTVKN